MSIRFKIILAILLASFLALVAGYIVISTQTLPYIQQLERKQLLKDIHRLNALIDQDAAGLSSIATDWGFWDDTYRFVQDRNQDYIDTNMHPDWLEKYEADALVIAAADRHWFEAVQADTGLPVQEILNPLMRSVQDDIGSGVIVIQQRVLLVGFARIRGTSGSHPQKGLVVLIRELNDQWLEQLSTRFGTQVTMTLAPPLVSPDVTFPDRSNAQVQISLPVMAEAMQRQETLRQAVPLPTLQPLITIYEPRELMTELRRILMSLIFSILLFLGLFTLILYIGLEHALIRPLRSIRERITHTTGADALQARVTSDIRHNRDDVATLELLMNAASGLLSEQHRQLREQRDLFEQRSLIDELTGLYNRRGLNQVFVARFRDKAGPLCCAILDLDYFKRVNDNHGHDAGDRVLVQFAGLLQGKFGDAALIARSGGEEFVVILETDAAAMELLLKQLNQNTGRMLGKRSELPVTVTVSAGFVAANEHSELGVLMSLADHALYEAKVHRNTIVGYQQLLSGSPDDHRLADQAAFRRYQYRSENDVA